MHLFFSGFLLSLSLCLDLGLVNVSMIKVGLERGFLPSFLLGVGSTFGDLIYAILSMIGISLLLQNIYVQWVLWLGGTAVLGYLTVHMVRETLHPKPIDVSARDASMGAMGTRSKIKFFLSGAGLALSSPTAILWFAAVGGSILATMDPHHSVTSIRHSGLPGVPPSLLLFFGGFFSAGITWSFGLAYVSGLAHRALGPQFLRYLSMTSAGLFLYFAYRVFSHGLTTLL